MGKNRRLLDEYRYPGFHPKAEIQGVFGDPKEKFAKMIEKHWDGIAAYNKPENKVPLGFVETIRSG